MRQQVHLRLKAPRNPWVLPPRLTRAALPAYRITLWARDTRVGRQTDGPGPGTTALHWSNSVVSEITVNAKRCRTVTA